MRQICIHNNKNNKIITKNYITMDNINNLIEAHYNELEVNDFDFYNDFNNNYNK